jgi:signal transduction histidine kinase
VAQGYAVRSIEGSKEPRTERFYGLIKRLDVLPPRPAMGPVRYSVPLVVYVGICEAGAILAAGLLIRGPQDWVTLLAGGVTALLMSAYAIQAFPPIRTTWSPDAFVQLGLSVSLGPLGAAVGATGLVLGLAIRSRTGWFRASFNAADIFLSNIVAYSVFTSVVGLLAHSVPASLVAGVAAGLAHWAANYFLLAIVVRLDDPHVPLGAIVRGGTSRLPYSVGYGLASFAFITMHTQAGALGFIALLAPVIVLQGFLVLFARSVHAYEEQRNAHQREREELLQRAVDASEAERRRIARDLHDGVVQNLAGMAFTLTATASQLKDHEQDAPNGHISEVLEQSAEETRIAMKDLRTLIIEIAPPTLRREGLHAALLEMLQTLKDAGTKTRLELPSNLRLRQDRASLIFRVAQEVLRNVVAHAEAKHVSVILKESDGKAVLRIVDDGKGFSQEQVARRRSHGHVGTSAIVELAEEAGGTLDIQSEPGKGTRVTLSLPAE